MSKLFEIQDALFYHLRNHNEGYGISTKTDIDWDAQPVIFFNGSKDSDNFFMGSFVIKKGPYFGHYTLNCPEYDTVYYTAVPTDDGRYILQLNPEIKNRIHGSVEVIA